MFKRNTNHSNSERNNELEQKIAELEKKLSVYTEILASLPYKIEVINESGKTFYENNADRPSCHSKEIALTNNPGYKLITSETSPNSEKTIKKLKDSEIRWKFAIEGNNNGLWDWNLETDEVYFSKQWKAMLGYANDEIENTLEEWDKRVHPDDKQAAYEDIEKHLKGETEIYENEHRLKCKDGTYKWIYDRGKIISYSPTGKPLRFIGTHTDITDKKKQQQKIRKNEERLMEAQKTAHIGHWELDIVNNILYWSDEVYRIFDLEPQEFKATYEAFLDNIHPDDRQMVAGAYENSLKTQKEYNITHRLLLKNGKIKYVNERCNTAFSEDGKPLFSIGTVADITELAEKERIIKKQNIELKAINATRDKLFSVIAHDLKSPFNGLIGFSDLALEYLEDKNTEEAHKCCRYISQTAHQCFDLLTNLLNWSKIQSGKIQLHPEELNLKSCIEENLSLLRSNSMNKNISIATSVHKDINVIADQNMLDSIIRNILSNAIKFSHPNSTIYLNAQKQENITTMKIKDSGMGMPPEIQHSLFDSNENLSVEGTGKEKGTGLGLVLCKEFIHLHEGVIWVDSEEGKGTTFTFTIKDRNT